MNKPTWTREWPKEKGKYWFSGYPFGKKNDGELQTILVDVFKNGSGGWTVVGDGHFIYESKAEDVWFQKAIIPERPPSIGKQGDVNG